MIFCLKNYSGILDDVKYSLKESIDVLPLLELVSSLDPDILTMW